jgi:hypothetical protein
MSKYFFDTEFLEGTQPKRFLGIKTGNTKPTIDLISIGVVSEDGREYYAISKEFNLKEAWNRYQIEYDHNLFGGQARKIYWLRENVLLSIYKDNVHGDMRNHIPFSYSTMKGILKGFGKTNTQIAEEVKEFVYNQKPEDKYHGTYKSNPEFYGYYADYDWVAFCWLFGKMIDLPDGFPMYCIDLKQAIDSWVNGKGKHEVRARGFDLTLKRLKDRPDYPKLTNEHNALADSRWNKELYEFLNKL